MPPHPVRDSGIVLGEVVLYSDEVSPGNQPKHTNRRKLQVVYWSLQELGSLRLTNESSWFVLTAVRT